MNKKLLTLVLSLLMAVMVTSAAFAEFVYVTKYGKKYHKADSRFIKDKATEELTREEAEARGYKPSSEFAEAENNSADLAIEHDSAKETRKK